MKRPRVLIPASLLLLTACGPAISSAFFEQAPPRPPDSQVQLYSTRLPSCPYEEIGLVRGRKRAFSSMQAVLASLQRRAREMGGDAIVGLGQGRTVTGATVVNDVASVDVSDGLAGTVIRFTDPDCRH
ncbi:MAG: hypothetical protein P8099_17315 [Gemmatimonadota bacterium]|jgi:hypothetical protein